MSPSNRFPERNRQISKRLGSAVLATTGSFFARAVERTIEGSARLAGGRRVIELATIVTLTGGVLMIVAEFLDLYHVSTALHVIDVPGAKQAAGSHHSYALLVIGLAAIGATLVARSTDQWQPAGGVLVLGVVALAIVLVGDLPAVMSSGLTDKFEAADTQPATGFWLELVGAVAVIGGGVALTYFLRAREMENGSYQR